MKVSLEQLEKSVARFDAVAEEKSRAKIEQHEAVQASKVNIAEEITEGNIIGDAANLKKRKEMIRAVGHEPVEFAYERAIGKNDSVYTNFIDLIHEAKKKVCRIVVKQGIKHTGYATGFMVSEELMLTNWHVFREKSEVGNSFVEFNYELDREGKATQARSFNLAPDTFFYSFEDLDYCLIAVDSMDTTGSHRLSDVGYISLEPKLGKLGDEDVELLNIIHHPKGDYKQLSIRENRFKRIMSTTLWYESDTAQGSSGSPVFNDQWQVVALHHMGVPKRNKKGQFLDKENEVIEPGEDGQIEISRVHWIANEGIRISVIRRHIFSIYPDSPMIAKLVSPAGRSTESSAVLHTSPTPQAKFPIAQDAIHVSIPSDVLERQKVVNIQISTENQNQPVSWAPSNPADLSPSDLEAESLRLERSMDYGRCKGYRSDFLGDDHRVAIPKPMKSVRNYVAKLHNSRAYILRYYKFSVIFNDLKRMPFISAVNIDGREDKRQDFTPRRDKWIRDTRIDLTSQLDNDFYSRSGFDRGHMSRREDANWGNTPDEAKRNADLTCVHTNACPQVPEINRSNRGGLWGKLEKVILEKGAKKEEGKTGKISVFNGPIFTDQDPIYKGVKIPMAFYKVVVWLNDAEELKATAFTLSQTDYVDEIDFEEINIDQDVTFKEHQVSMRNLQEQTQLDLEDLFEIDTFTGNEPAVAIENESRLIERIQV